MYIMVAGARDRYLIKGSEPWISWFAYLSLCGVFIDICRLMAFPSNGEVSIRTYLNRLIKGWVGHGDGWGPQFGIGVAGDLTFRICSCCGEMACPRVGVVFLSLHLWKKLLPLLTNNFWFFLNEEMKTKMKDLDACIFFLWVLYIYFALFFLQAKGLFVSLAQV